jgi:tripartite-type tricarboxylate transporter receptor subunit TctC
LNDSARSGARGAGSEVIDEKRRRLVLRGLMVAALPITGRAQSYPDKPIRFIVPWPAGGIADVRARIMAEHLSKGLGQPVIVENRPGASGSVGAAMVAKSKPDGYTVMYGSVQEQVLAPLLLAEVAYAPDRDFTHITQFTRTPIVLVATPRLVVRSVAELIALAKSKPGRLTYGSPGVAHTNHLAAEQFRLSTGIEVAHVSYKGEAPMLADLLGGQIDYGFAYIGTSAPLVRAGKLNALLVSGARRAPQLPAVPTAAEAALPELDIFSWGGLMGPAGMSADVVQRLNSEMVKVLRSPAVNQRSEFADSEVVAGTPEEFRAFALSDSKRWANIIEATGVKAD